MVVFEGGSAGTRGVVTRISDLPSIFADGDASRVWVLSYQGDPSLPEGPFRGASNKEAGWPLPVPIESFTIDGDRLSPNSSEPVWDRIRRFEEVDCRKRVISATRLPDPVEAGFVVLNLEAGDGRALAAGWSDGRGEVGWVDASGFAPITSFSSTIGISVASLSPEDRFILARRWNLVAATPGGEWVSVGTIPHESTANVARVARLSRGEGAGTELLGVTVYGAVFHFDGARVRELVPHLTRKRPYDLRWSEPGVGYAVGVGAEFGRVILGQGFIPIDVAGLTGATTVNWVPGLRRWVIAGADGALFGYDPLWNTSVSLGQASIPEIHELEPLGSALVLTGADASLGEVATFEAGQSCPSEAVASRPVARVARIGPGRYIGATFSFDERAVDESGRYRGDGIYLLEVRSED